MSKLEQLEGYTPLKTLNIDENLSRLAKKKKTELFLFQIPKDINLDDLDGIEIPLDSEGTATIEGSGKEKYSIERVRRDIEKFVKNQSIALFPTKKTIKKDKNAYKAST